MVFVFVQVILTLEWGGCDQILGKYHHFACHWELQLD